jgi:iron complex outermembrane recepter protein
MKKALIQAGSFCCSALALATATAAQAQDPSAANPQASAPQGSADIGDIVVTANRREQSLSQVGMSITAIGSEQIQNRNITSAADLSRLVPGLTVADTGYSIPVYSLRGVGVNEQTIGNSSSVAIYVDEVPLSLPATTVGATLDVQRIEVLKGPQGTLYGQNSTGGAINYIANKPTPDFSAGVTGSYGRFNTASVEGFVSGPITSTLGARLAVRTIQSGDWQRSISRDASLGETHRLAGRGIIEWKPTSDFEVALNFNGWTDKSDTLAPQLLAVRPSSPAFVSPRVTVAPLAANNARSADWDAGQDYGRNDHFYQGSVRMNWSLNDQLTLTSITAYDRLKIDALLDIDGMGVSAVDGRNITVVRSQQDAQAKQFSQEVRLSAQFNGVQWVVGANYNRDTIAEQIAQNLVDSSAGRGTGYTGGTIDIRQRVRSWAVFTNLDLPLTDTLSLTAGIRLSKEMRKFDGCFRDIDGTAARAFDVITNRLRAASGLPPLTPAQASKQGGCVSSDADLVPTRHQDTLSQDNVPWNVNLNWKPGSGLLFYGRVSQGYKSGNFPTLAGVSNIAIYRPVVQEELRAYEIGTRLRLAPTLRLEAAAFWYDYKNKQQRGRVDAGPPIGLSAASINVPKSRIKGVEGSIVYQPTRGLDISASGTYLDSEVREYTGFNLDGVRLDQAGYPLNFTPKYSANLDVNYERPVNGALSGFVGVNVGYRSKTTAGIAASSIYDIHAYTLVDGQLGVKSADDRWKVWIYGKNIFNEYYASNVVRVADGVLRYAGMPATYGISASYRF